MTRQTRIAEPTSIREILPGIVRAFRAGAPRLDAARKAWVEVVGPVVAARTHVAGLEDGRMRVEVASAPLKHDLETFRRDEILRGLGERAPELRIQEVSFRLAALR